MSIQLKTLEELEKRKTMTSKELRSYIEKLGGDYSTILPILKNSGLIKAERGDTSRRGRTSIHSTKLKKLNKVSNRVGERKICS